MSSDESSGGDNDQDEALGELVDALNDIDETSDNAEENTTTIDDNNGGRIELDEKIEHKPLPSTLSVLNQENTVIRLVMKKPDKIKLVIKKKPEQDQT